MSKLTNARGAAALLIGAVALSAMSFTAASAANCSYVFTKTLKKGSTGVEVMNLQKTLNLSAATMVASTGAGSAGNETMTFGSATRAAVIKFQAANSISPTSGLVGPLTRGVLNTFCSGTGTTTGTGTGTGTTTSGPVSVSNGTMINSTLVDDSVGSVLGSFVFSGNGTVTGVELMRTGVSTDQTLRNVYLYDGATRLTDSASVITGGAIKFNASNGIFSVNGSKTITVRADIGDGLSNIATPTGSTNGQQVGVAVAKVTTSAGTSMISGVMSANQTIASVTNIATVVLTGAATSSASVNAGVLNQTLWTRTFDIGQRDVMMKGLTFKYVGSAPTDSVANIGLFVDGVKVGSGSVDSNMRVVFDMSSMPKTLTTGSHTVELRGDIVKGSFRNFEFSIERQADIMLADSSLAGVSIGATVAGQPAQNVLGTTFSVLAGTLTIVQDPAFTTTKAIGGTSNSEISKFKLQAYGEDVKVETLVIQPMLTGAVANTAATGTAALAGLQNVSLFVNGGAIGSSQNWAGPATTNPLIFNLGSSLIVPAGTSVILTVKADTKTTTGLNYTAGNIQADIVSSGSVARGQSSQNTSVVTNQTGRLLTIGSTNATFSKTGGFVNNVASPNTANVKIGSYTVTAGDLEDLVVTNIGITPTITVAAVTDFSALKLGGNDSSTIYGQFSASAQNFSMNVTVPKNTSKVFEVFADVGSATSSATISTAATITFRGVVNANPTTQPSTGGTATLTFNTAAIPAANVTKLTSSPVSQLVVGGTTNQAIVTYNVKATGGTATIQELTFDVAGGADRVTSIMVGGVTRTVTGLTGNLVTGLNIAVPEGNSGVDVPVTVNYGTVRQPSGGVAADTTASTGITLQILKAISGSQQILTPAIAQSSNLMQLVSTKPTLTVPNTSLTGLGNTEVKIGEVTVAADAAGNLKVNRFVFDVTPAGATLPTIATPRIADGSTTVAGAVCAGTTVVTCDFGTASLTDADGYTVVAGTSKTFSLYATIGAVSGAAGTVSVSSKLQVGATGISWDDINASATNLTGANVYNYPTGSYSVKN